MPIGTILPAPRFATRHAILQAERTEASETRAELDGMLDANPLERERLRMQLEDASSHQRRELERDGGVNYFVISAIIAAGDSE